MRSWSVEDQVLMQVLLHLLHRLMPLLPALDPEVFVQQRAVQPLHETVALGPAHPCGAMLDVLKLQEKLVGMPVRPTAELPALSLRIILIGTPCCSKKGSTFSLSTSTAVKGSLEV
jgi:hypothetical protein